MNSQKSLSFLSLVMAEVPFDPVLRSFWERFPCPPSWNNDLLFRTNWTSCVTPSVGERIILFMADKCGIKNLPSNITPPSRDDNRGDILHDTCTLTCQIVVGLVCALFVLLTVTGIIIIVYRKRKCKRKSNPPHASSNSGDKMFSSGVNSSRRQPSNNIPDSTLGDQNQNPLLRRPLPPLPNNCHFANYRILADGDNSSSCASHSTGGQSPVYEYIDDQSVHYGCQPCHVCHRHSRELGCVACVPTRQNYNRNSQDLIRFSFGHSGYNDDPCDEIWFDEQGRQYNAPWNDRHLINMFKDTMSHNDPRAPRDAMVPSRSHSGHRLSRDSREMMPFCGCSERSSIERSDADIINGNTQSLSNETQFVNNPNDSCGVTIHYNPRNSQGFQDGRRRMPSRGCNSHRHSRPEMHLSPSGDRLSARESSDRRPIPAVHADYFSSDA